MPLIDFIRRGDTERPGLLLGRTDGALSEAGWRQFERQTANRRWSVVVSSPLRRARDPAAKLAQMRNLQLRTDPDWAELDFGAWDGRQISELMTDPVVANSLDEIYRNPNVLGHPDGENWQALQIRVTRALSRLVQDSRAESSLVITHGGHIRTALSLACGIPFHTPWAHKINCGTRVTLRVGSGEPMWGEIIEIVEA